MDPILFEAAVSGDVNVLKRTLSDQLEVQVTPTKNSVLHIAALAGQTLFVKEVLQKCGRSLFGSVNIRGETPLHIAAREGHAEIAVLLIEYARDQEEEGLESGIGAAKAMLRMRASVDGDTALHLAVRNNRPSLVHMLTEEDPHFLHPCNDAHETPLYLAAERSYPDIVSRILTNCTSPAYTGLQGRTALHAAAIWDSQECMEALLKWKPDLTKDADVHGWTPLHFAARLNNVDRVKQLLAADKSVAYLAAENDDNRTALHIAACEGHRDVMKEILSRCPDCWDMVSSRGQNILHFAMESEDDKAIRFILKDPLLSRLINQKDMDGNTPLHLYAASNIGNLYQLTEHPKLDKMAFNNNHLTALDVVKYSNTYKRTGADIEAELKNNGVPLGQRNIISKDNETRTEWKRVLAEITKKVPKENRTDAQGTHLIVATLIATMTFAAGFTVPGGYDGNEGPNQGLAVFVKKAAFKAFAVTDTLAMAFSITAVFFHIMASLYGERDKRENRYTVAMVLIMCAIAATMVAFMTGFYVVSAPSSAPLAVTVCVICCLFFPFFYLLLKKRINHVFKPPKKYQMDLIYD